MSNPFVTQLSGTITGQDPINNLIDEIQNLGKNSYSKAEVDGLLNGKYDNTTTLNNIALNNGDLNIKDHFL